MKTQLRTLAIACMAFVATTLNTFAGNDNNNPTTATAPNVSGWISSPGATFDVLTHKTNDVLSVSVKNTAKQAIMITLHTPDGLELAYEPIHRRAEGRTVKFNVTELADGEYMVKIANRQETITKKVTLISQPKPSRQAVITVAR